MLENIIEDSNLNVSQLKTDTGYHDVTIKKVNKIKKLLVKLILEKKIILENKSIQISGFRN